eukprot:1774101-Amphidinium_carterae.1
MIVSFVVPDSSAYALLEMMFDDSGCGVGVVVVYVLGIDVVVRKWVDRDEKVVVVVNDGVCRR